MRVRGIASPDQEAEILRQNVRSQECEPNIRRIDNIRHNWRDADDVALHRSSVPLINGITSVTADDGNCVAVRDVERPLHLSASPADYLNN